MESRGYEPQTELAKRFFTEGKAEAKAEDLLMVLQVRGLAVTDQRATIESCKDVDVIGCWHKRALTASSTSEVLGDLPGR